MSVGSRASSGTRVARAVLALALLAGCGTRLSHAEVVAADGGGPVTINLPPDVLGQLRSGQRAPATQPVMPAPTAVAPAGAPAVPLLPKASGVRPTANRTPAAALTGPAAGQVTHEQTTCAGALSPVALGQVGTFSGLAGALTASARSAMAAWAKDINGRGGLACHPVQLFAEDDDADPAHAAADVQDLVDRHHVIALVGSIIAFTAAGFVPAVAAAKLPVVGGDSTDPQWFASPWLFPQGASLDDQATGILRAGVAAGHRKVGLLYCVETSACTYVDKQVKDSGAQAAGAELVYDSPISVTQPDFTAQCLNARNAGVDLLGLAMDGSSMTRLARSCAAVGYRPLLAVGAATFTLHNTEDPNLRAFGVVSESPVAPWMARDTPAAQAFQAAMARYAPQVAPDGEAILAWTSGKLLESVVAKWSAAQRSGDLTTAAILDGLGRIQAETLGGLTGPLSFTPGEKHAVSNGCVYFERLSTEGWTTPTGSKPVCR